MGPSRGQSPEFRPLDGLQSALAQAPKIGLSNKLNNIYQALPNTGCLRQGHCCALLPPLLPAEMLAWLVRLADRPGPERGGEAARLVEHFLLNAALRRPCPWALPRACAVYDRRFLACRSYGLWSAGAYEARRQAALAAQERAAAAWRELGVELPPEVLAPGPEYCDQVRLDPNGENRPIADADLELAEERLAGLVRGMPGLEPLLASAGDLSYLVARLTLGERQCLEAKMEVTRSLLKHQGERAADALIQNMNIAYNIISSWTI